MSGIEIDHVILNCFEGTEWHLSLWFPRVARAVVGVPASVPDAEVQSHLLHLIECGVLEAGAVEGSEFAVRPLELGGDLYVRAACTG